MFHIRVRKSYLEWCVRIKPWWVISYCPDCPQYHSSPVSFVSPVSKWRVSAVHNVRLVVCPHHHHHVQHLLSLLLCPGLWPLCGRLQLLVGSVLSRHCPVSWFSKSTAGPGRGCWRWWCRRSRSRSDSWCSTHLLAASLSWPADP